MEVAGKNAVITGGASGIGLAVARALVAAGANVVIADIEVAALQEAAASLDCLGVRTDVSQMDSVRALAQTSIAALGQVHILMNNAGVAGEVGSCWESTLEGWKWAVGVNLWGVIHGVQAFLPHMLAHGEQGHVVNTASAAAFLPIPFAAAYGVTKAGVVSLSESLYNELVTVGSNIGVSVLCPAAVQTRIADSDRNRPDVPRKLPDEQRQFLRSRKEMVKEAIAAGMPAETVAAHVLRAIRENRLYVMTHDEVFPWIEARTSNILAGRNPEVHSMLENS
ncbi:MAG: SDR family NAD(P)-dependent oxidoreductase [Bryobacteraceae bacterium]